MLPGHPLKGRDTKSVQIVNYYIKVVKLLLLLMFSHFTICIKPFVSYIRLLFWLLSLNRIVYLYILRVAFSLCVCIICSFSFSFSHLIEKWSGLIWVTTSEFVVQSGVSGCASTGLQPNILTRLSFSSCCISADGCSRGSHVA